MIQITTTERIAIVAATLLAFIIAAACHTALRPTTIVPRPTPWCVTAVRSDGEHITACTERQPTCAQAKAFAEAWGEAVQIATVDEQCVYHQGATP